MPRSEPLYSWEEYYGQLLSLRSRQCSLQEGWEDLCSALREDFSNQWMNEEVAAFLVGLKLGVLRYAEDFHGDALKLSRINERLALKAYSQVVILAAFARCSAVGDRDRFAKLVLGILPSEDFENDCLAIETLIPILRKLRESTFRALVEIDMASQTIGANGRPRLRMAPKELAANCETLATLGLAEKPAPSSPASTAGALSFRLTALGTKLLHLCWDPT